MKKLKQVLLSAGFGKPYFDFWWRHRCPFELLTEEQEAKGYYYVHIPKTAGTSMISALGVRAMPYTHCPARVVQQKYPTRARKLRFFTVVRDPYTRFASSFRYITQRSDWPAQRAFGRDVIGDLSFSDFILKMQGDRWFRNLVLGYEFFFPQSYFTHHQGKALIDDVLKFETLSADFENMVQKRFPDVASLPALRDHGGGDYMGMYDDNIASFIRDIYADDFRHFGYAS